MIIGKIIVIRKNCFWTNNIFHPLEAVQVYSQGGRGVPQKLTGWEGGSERGQIYSLIKYHAIKEGRGVKISSSLIGGEGGPNLLT